MLFGRSTGSNGWLGMNGKERERERERGGGNSRCLRDLMMRIFQNSSALLAGTVKYADCISTETPHKECSAYDPKT